MNDRPTSAEMAAAPEVVRRYVRALESKRGELTAAYLRLLVSSPVPERSAGVSPEEAMLDALRRFRAGA